MPKDKKEKLPETKKQKRVIGIGIAFLVIFSLIIAGFVVVKSSETVQNSLMYLLMPKSMDLEFEGDTITFYVEKNKDFSADKNQPIEAFKLYYYKDNDKSKDKVYLEKGGRLSGEAQSTNLMVLSFLVSANATMNILKAIGKYLLIILIVLFAIYLIYLWYLNWCKREDKRKEQNQQ